MKNNIFKSVASLALSLALVFSATAIFSTYTASAADSTSSKAFNFDSVQAVKFSNSNGAFSISQSVYRGESGKSLQFNWKSETSDVSAHKTLISTSDSATGAYQVEWGKTYKVTLYYKTEGTAPNGPCRLGIYTSGTYFNNATPTYQVIEKPLYFETTDTKDWIKYETRFTAIQNNSSKTSLKNFGLGIVFPKGNYASSDYSIYIDDVIIAEDTGDPVTVPENTFNFDNAVLDSSMANSFFTISNEADYGDKGGSSLKTYKESSNKGDTTRIILSTTDKNSGRRCNIVDGKTYKVTLKYKTVGNAPSDTAWQLGLFTSSSDSYKEPVEQTMHDMIWFRKTPTNGWVQAETTFTADLKNTDKTSLGLRVIFPAEFSNNTDYAVYIDDVTVEETDAPATPDATTKTFDFTDTVYNPNDLSYANSPFGIGNEDLHIADSGKSLVVYRKEAAAGDYKALLTTKNKTEGEKYSVEWGKTYKVTLWYKTVGNFTGEAWTLGLFTGSESYTSDSFKQKDTGLSFSKEATDWTKLETTFTATESNAEKRNRTYLGIGVNLPAFSDNKDYKVYIDDVTVSEIRDNGDVNGDSNVDTEDFNTLRRELLNNNTASANKCDVNGDGSVNICDLVALDEILKQKNN